MSDSNAAVGDMTFYYLTHLVESGDAVADEINLSVSRHFEIDSLRNEFGRECSHLSVDRLTIGWGSTHNTHIAGSHQRELQGSRNRGCRHSESIDITLQLTQFFFCGNAKFLLFVNDEQSEVFPFYILGQHAMGSYEDVNLATLELFE